MTNTNNFDLAAALETLRTTDRPALDKLLLESAAVGNDAAVDALLEAGGSTEAKNREGCTALHLAAWHGHASTAERLIAQSARIDIDAPDKFGWTPLHFAARYGQTETAALLIAMDASTGAKNDIGKTPLHYAAWEGHTAIMEMLGERHTPSGVIDAVRAALKALQHG